LSAGSTREGEILAVVAGADDLEVRRPAEERPDQAAVAAEERRRSTSARLSEPPQLHPA
jgi:hypothetical protein